MTQNKSKNILVFGGTRYFGKHLVRELIGKSHAVTIATRGKAADPFGDRVKRLVLDRYDRQSLGRVLHKQTWDLVYDQICYAPTDAADVCEILTGKVGRYVFTSSMSVYPSGLARKETDFDPWHYKIQMGRRDDFSYAEGKRQAEAIFFQRAAFPVAAVRFPIVLGPDDYSGRLHAPIRAVKNNEALPVNNPEAAISLISSEEAGRFLAWLSHETLSGVFNAASNGDVPVADIIHLIENELGKKALISLGKFADPFSLIAPEESLTLDTTKAQKAGFEFKATEQWVRPLINKLTSLT